MKIAVISDIHGNAIGLETALRDLQVISPDQVVCLGDAIQGGPQPAECVAILRDKGWPIVMGNADAWMLTGIETTEGLKNEEIRQELYDVREWSLTRLTDDDKKYIEGFAPTITLDLQGSRSLLCFHGTPTSFDELVLPWIPEEDFQRMFRPYAPAITTGGHVHVQFIRHLDRSFHFNPGSIGFAYRHGQDRDKFRADPWAEYAVLTVTASDVSLEFRRVAYDPQPLIDVYRSSGRPHSEAAAKQYS